MTKPSVHVSALLTVEDFEELRRHAELHDRSLSAELRRAISEYVRRHRRALERLKENNP